MKERNAYITMVMRRRNNLRINQAQKEQKKVVKVKKKKK
jgi:hypothetical protein